MAAPASGSAGERLSRLLKEVEMECGDIASSQQQELLAGAPFLGGMGARAVFAAERLSPLGKVVEMDCGDITSSQEELLARAPFLGGGAEEEEPEVFSTPPLTHGHHQGQVDEGGDDKEGDVITMCSLPFTQTQPSPSPSPPDEVVRPRKPRVCIRKVRGARIRTPTPSPDGRRAGGVDPLYRAVLMIPTPPAPHTAAEDILTLARQRGIF